MEGGKPEKYVVVLFGPTGRRTYMNFIGERSVWAGLKQRIRAPAGRL